MLDRVGPCTMPIVTLQYPLSGLPRYGPTHLNAAGDATCRRQWDHVGGGPQRHTLHEPRFLRWFKDKGDEDIQVLPSGRPCPPLVKLMCQVQMVHCIPHRWVDTLTFRPLNLWLVDNRANRDPVGRLIRARWNGCTTKGQEREGEESQERESKEAEESKRRRGWWSQKEIIAFKSQYSLKGQSWQSWAGGYEESPQFDALSCVFKLQVKTSLDQVRARPQDPWIQRVPHELGPIERC